MIEILQIIQEKYVPTVVKVESDGSEVANVMDEIFVGGDQLSEEKARNAQGDMADGDTKLDRLQVVIPKNEDWHAIRYMHAVSKIVSHAVQVDLKMNIKITK